jgi:hypothetical protein
VVHRDPSRGETTGMRCLASLPLLSAATAAALAGPAAAQAATADVQPSAAGARTFATGPAGWTSGVTRAGVVCLPAVTCPAVAQGFQPTGGTGGAADGFLRTRAAQLAQVAATATGTWRSPAFTAAGPVDRARLGLALRSHVDGLVAVNPDVDLRVVLVDTADASRNVNVLTRALGDTAGFTRLSATLPGGAVVSGRTYRLELRTRLAALVGVPLAVTTDFDDVALQLIDDDGSGGPGTGGPGAGGPGNGGPGSGTPGTGTGGGGGAPGTKSDPGGYASVLGACYRSSIAITGVRTRGHRVTLRGMSAFAPGTAMTVRTVGGRRLGATSGRADGTFRVSVRRPASMRGKRARVRVHAAGTRSNAAFVKPVNAVRELRVAGRTVTVRGHVDLARLGRSLRFAARGGRGPAACVRGGRKLKVRRVRVDRRTGAYSLRVRVPAGSGRLAVRTRALGRYTAYSTFGLR